ncbi:conjugal transfer protein [Curtobacterium sp. PhB136]|uniref:conjugal transfer protein n=1 Tax=Curtobacterium sp. PhB136 TaxID=2485181 RepID=UPI001043C568|nr:conjugal transfer protein [Curtobacterium sp. PhB136]TCK58298.1 conjugative transposon protein TcpC [Curtobacterium sp. PhB136]
MKLPKKKTPQPASTEPETTAQAAQWTNGGLLGARGVTIAIAAALVCGPAALAMTVLSGGGSSEAAPQVVSSEQVSPLQQSAGSFAAGFVGAWLAADRDNSSALDAYTTANIELPKTGFQYRDLVVASSTTTRDGLAQVVVAANVKDDTIDADKGDQWPRRYFQVTVTDGGNKLSAVGLPAPVAGPRHTTDGSSLGYGETIATNSAAGKAVNAFLAAYLTGQGDTEPYTAPSKSIPPIDPAPYTSLSISTLTATTAPSEHPTDGATVNVYATVTASNSVGQQVTATYPITLRARADRWEVSGLGTAPTLSNSDAATPAPSATPAPTEGN